MTIPETSNIRGWGDSIPLNTANTESAGWDAAHQEAFLSGTLLAYISTEDLRRAHRDLERHHHAYAEPTQIVIASELRDRDGSR